MLEEGDGLTASDWHLANVRRQTFQSSMGCKLAERNFKAALAEARKPRRAAIVAALDAGIPRKDVADAAGISFSRMYQIIKQDK